MIGRNDRKNREGERKTFALDSYRKAIAKNKTVIVVLAAVLLLLVSGVLYLIVQSTLTPKTNEYVLELTYDITDNTSYGFFKDKIVGLNSDGMKIYEADGLVSYSNDTYMSNPVLCVGEKYILAYDSGGRNLYITDGSAVRFENNFDSMILKAKFASNGALVVISAAENYKAVVTVYDKHFKAIYRWSSASEYVADADITENGKLLAVATYTGNNASIAASINYFSLTSTDRLAKTGGISGIPYAVDFKDGDKLHILTGDGLYYLEGVTEAVALYTFDSSYLKYFGTVGSDITAILVNRNVVGGDSDLLFFEDKSLLKLVNIDGEVRDISVSEDYVGVLTTKSAKVFENDGEYIFESPATTQSKKLIISKDGNMIVFDLNKVTLVK